MNTKTFIIFRDKVVHDKDNASYESTAISILSLYRQTWCSSITMIHPNQTILQWAGSPQALFVVYSSTLWNLVQLLLLAAVVS